MKYKYYCDYLYLDYKKDLTQTISISISILVIGVALYFIFNTIYALAFAILGIVYFIMHINSLKEQYKHAQEGKEIAFNAFYRYLLTLLENGNILYQALQMTLNYVDEILVKDIEVFISDIEHDVSYTPFISFASKFNDETIKQMVLMLYQTQESESVELVLERLNECLVKLQDSAIDSYLKKEVSKIEKFNVIPLILSALIMILVSVFIFTLIGEGIYV